MSKKTKLALLTIFIGLSGLFYQSSFSATKGTAIDKAIYSATVIPFDYKSQILSNGKYTVYDDKGELAPRMIQNRVMVPVKMISSILQSDYNKFWCELLWDKAKPDDVILQRRMIGTGKLVNKIVLKNGSKTMLVDGRQVTLDVAPRVINGRIFLPLRGITQVLGKFVYWQDNLIFMSDEAVDFNTAKAKSVISDTKKVLSQKINTNHNISTTLLGVVNGEKYLYKQAYDEKTNNWTRNLIRINADNKEIIIPLSVPPIREGRLINGQYYYIGKTANGVSLYKYNINTKSLDRLADFKDIQWDETFGWIAGINLIDERLWVTVHYGDGIMGGDSLFIVEDSKFTEIASAKYFGHWYIIKDKLYYSDSSFMTNSSSLYKIDLSVKPYKAVSIGEKEWGYDVIKIFNKDTKSISQGINSSGFFIDNDIIYTSGYRYDKDEQNEVSCILRINLKDNTTLVISNAIKSFDKYKDNLYYIRLDDESFIRIDSNGGNKTVISDKPIYSFIRLNNYFYYTLLNPNLGVALPGIYCYDADTGNTAKISDNTADKLYIEDGNVYYESNSYKKGTYKLN